MAKVRQNLFFAEIGWLFDRASLRAGLAGEASADLAFGGRIVSYVYGVSTVGNVLGTLVTTFVLVPEFGSRALTMIFAGVTIVCGIVMMYSCSF